MKDPIAVALARKRWRGTTARERRAAVPRNGGRPKVPTLCPRCGNMQASAVEARRHCRK